MIILFDLVKRDLGTVGPAGKAAFQQPDQLVEDNGQNAVNQNNCNDAGVRTYYL